MTIYKKQWLISPKGDKLKYVLQMNFPTPSNNEAEYEAPGLFLHSLLHKSFSATNGVRARYRFEHAVFS